MFTAHALPWLKGEALVRRLAVDGGVRRTVEVRLHEQILAPLTSGFVRPAIVLPTEAQEWSDADVEHAIIHELEHVRRADWVVHLGARAVSALYWFHPLVWTAWRRLRLESERACDDTVLRSADRTAYADQLVSLARRLSTSAPPPMLSIATRSDLSARVSAVLDTTQSRGRVGTMSSVATVSVALVILLVIAPIAPIAQTSSPVPSQGAESSNAGFVVTSVKWNTTGNGTRSAPFVLGPNGRFAVTNMTVLNLIANAYQGSRVEGGPDWLASDRFDIEAKAEGNPSSKEMWPMVRELLADRFSLMAHTETRMVPGYGLVMTDGTLGPRLTTSACVGRDTALPTPIDQSLPPPCGLYRGRPAGRFEGRWMTMEEFAFGLTAFAGRKVVDRTGLTGKFDVDVEWTPAPGPPGPSTLAVGSTIFAAFEQQLGLSLAAQDGPVDFLIIDRVERPTVDR